MTSEQQITEPEEKNIQPVEDVESTKKDSAPETTPETVPQVITDRLSKSWAAISKKEASIRHQTKLLAEQKAQLDQAMSEIAELRKLRDGLKNDPVPILDEVSGKDWYQKATQRFLADASGKIPVEDKVASLEARLEQERKDRDKWFEEKFSQQAKHYEEQASHQQQAGDYLNQMHKLVASDDRFELTRMTPGGTDAVVELVNGHLKEHGKLLPVEEAVMLVEQELEIQAESMLKAQKLRAKYKLEDQSPKAKSSGNTLTDKLSASGTPAFTGTREQQIEEAANLLRRMKIAQ